MNQLTLFWGLTLFLAVFHLTSVSTAVPPPTYSEQLLKEKIENALLDFEMLNLETQPKANLTRLHKNLKSLQSQYSKTGQLHRKTWAFVQSELEAAITKLEAHLRIKSTPTKADLELKDAVEAKLLDWETFARTPQSEVALRSFYRQLVQFRKNLEATGLLHLKVWSWLHERVQERLRVLEENYLKHFRLQAHRYSINRMNAGPSTTPPPSPPSTRDILQTMMSRLAAQMAEDLNSMDVIPESRLHDYTLLLGQLKMEISLARLDEDLLQDRVQLDEALSRLKGKVELNEDIKAEVIKLDGQLALPQVCESIIAKDTEEIRSLRTRAANLKMEFIFSGSLELLEKKLIQLKNQNSKWITAKSLITFDSSSVEALQRKLVNTLSRVKYLLVDGSSNQNDLQHRLNQLGEWQAQMDLNLDQSTRQLVIDYDAAITKLEQANLRTLSKPKLIQLQTRIQTLLDSLKTGNAFKVPEQSSFNARLGTLQLGVTNQIASINARRMMISNLVKQMDTIYHQPPTSASLEQFTQIFNQFALEAQAPPFNHNVEISKLLRKASQMLATYRKRVEEEGGRLQAEERLKSELNASIQAIATSVDLNSQTLEQLSDQQKQLLAVQKRISSSGLSQAVQQLLRFSANQVQQKIDVKLNSLKVMSVSKEVEYPLVINEQLKWNDTNDYN